MSLDLFLDKDGVAREAPEYSVTIYFDTEKEQTNFEKRLKNMNKYRWHDLRKNPEDLPKDMENVQICWLGGTHNWYDSMFYHADKKYFSLFSGTPHEIVHPVIGNEEYAGHGRAIAWRYIEEFPDEDEVEE